MKNGSARERKKRDCISQANIMRNIWALRDLVTLRVVMFVDGGGGGQRNDLTVQTDKYSKANIGDINALKVSCAAVKKRWLQFRVLYHISLRFNSSATYFNI